MILIAAASFLGAFGGASPKEEVEMMELNKQQAFMTACGQTCTKFDAEQFALYITLIKEEAAMELIPAAEDWSTNLADLDKLRLVIDGIGDVLVVVYGLAYSLGLDPEKIKDAIDDSNLTKIPVDGFKVDKRSDGKIIKPATFVEPKLDVFVNKVLKSILSYAGIK